MQRGFSLIEMIVSVALFAIVMLVAVGALLSIVDANRKARSLESVMNNLNITLDGMVREIRMGTSYNCGSSAVPALATAAADCVGGSSPAVFSFAPYGTNPTVQNTRWVYSFSNGVLYRSRDGGATQVAVTAPEVTINSLVFYVAGTMRREINQPKVVIVIQGTAGAQKNKTKTTFYIQSTAVQRTLDL